MPQSLIAQGNPADSAFVGRKGIDEIETISSKDPNRAALLSAVLPGLGQAYNNQFWKIPLIYGGGVMLGHYIRYNHVIYNEFRNAVIAEQDGLESTVNPYNERYAETAITRFRDVFRRNRDLLIILTAAFYMLNIVDAHVSAHLHEFEVNDQLSMRVMPSIQTTSLQSRAIGLSLSINFN